MTIRPILIAALVFAFASAATGAYAQKEDPSKNPFLNPNPPKLNPMVPDPTKQTISQMSPEMIANNRAVMKSPGSKPTMKLVSSSGPITIKTAKGVTTVNPGDPMPPLATGDVVTVVSGQAVFSAGDETVTVGAGSAFSVAFGKNTVSISPTSGTVSVAKGETVTQVKVGETSVAKTTPPVIPSQAAAPSNNAAPAPTPSQQKSISPSVP